jgi:hypothetical protein
MLSSRIVHICIWSIQVTWEDVDQLPKEEAPKHANVKSSKTKSCAEHTSSPENIKNQRTIQTCEEQKVEWFPNILVAILTYAQM